MVVNIFNFSSGGSSRWISSEFEASLVYTSSSRENFSQKQKQNQKNLINTLFYHSIYVNHDTSTIV